jgi:beta-1,4-mannosyl-glycoprotein beta-1,4-N-acetylglucosaminyltransferase
MEPESGPRRRDQAVALKTGIRRQWDTGSIARFTAMALALHRIRTLNAGYVRRLAWALVAQGRFEDARPLFGLVEEDDHWRWWDEARALAGCGRLAEAAEAAGRCAERLAEAPREPDPVAAAHAIDRRPSRLDVGAGWPGARVEIRSHLQTRDAANAGAALRAFLQRRAELLQEAIAAAAEPAAGDWPQLRRQAVADFLLGLDVGAAERLMEASGGAIKQAAPLFAAASAALPPARQCALLQAFAAFAEAGVHRDFIALALDALEGGRAAGLARAPRPSDAIVAAVATMLAQAGHLALAVTLFGELATGKHRSAPRQELALCQSRETTARIPVRTGPRAGARQIFDLFPYNGELELLKIKLHEMGPWVDRFVLVESATTFSGQPKPLHFGEAAQAQVAAFHARISHVVIEAFPDHVTSAWARELYQRDQAAEALQGLCAPDDLVILSDVDEVLDRHALEDFEDEIAPLNLQVFRLFLNYRLARRQGRKTVVCPARHLEHWGSSLLRMLAPRLAGRPVDDAGWHFSSVGAAEDVARKLASYSHQEHHRPDNEARYRGLIEQLRAGELEPGWERCGLEELPAYVADNRERLAQLLL